MGKLNLVTEARKCICDKQLAVVKGMILGALQAQSPIRFKDLIPLFADCISVITIALAMIDLEEEGKIKVFYRLVDKHGNVSPQKFKDISNIPKEMCEMSVDINTYLEKI